MFVPIVYYKKKRKASTYQLQRTRMIKCNFEEWNESPFHISNTSRHLECSSLQFPFSLPFSFLGLVSFFPPSRKEHSTSSVYISRRNRHDFHQIEHNGSGSYTHARSTDQMRPASAQQARREEGSDRLDEASA